MQTNLTFEPEFDELYNAYSLSPEGKELLALEGISRDKLDIGKMSYQYFTEKLPDISVDQNANANESFGPNNYNAEVVKGISKINGYYLIWRYAKSRYDLRTANKLMRAIWNGDVYFHDPTKIMTNYCLAITTSNITFGGRPYGQLKSVPPKRADSFIASAVEAVMDLSNNFLAGACALSDVFVQYAWFSKKENKTDDAIVNDLQKMVHVFNNQFRLGGESAFTNLSLFDRENLKLLFGELYYPDGTQIDIEYVIHIEKLFGTWFSHGDPTTGFPYRFPVCTVNLYVDDNNIPTDEDFLDWLAETNIEKGTFNIYANQGTKIASCCRLSNDLTRMHYKVDTFGNGSLNLGCHRVVTINMPRLGIMAEGNEDMFFRLLDNRLESAKKLLLVHREEILNRRIENGFLQFFKPLNWASLDRMFSTIGIVGMHETNHNMGLDIRTEAGIAFTAKVLRHIEKRLDEFSEETKHSFNAEMIPSEGSSPILAKKDKIMFGASSQPFQLYSNQFIPLIEDASILERIKAAGCFQSILSGGDIIHINLSSKIQNKEQMKKLILVMLKNGVCHGCVNYGFATCEQGHATVAGNAAVCPECGAPIKEYLTRIVGYFVPVKNWNHTRREFEFPARKFSALSDIIEIPTYQEEIA